MMKNAIIAAALTTTGLFATPLASADDQLARASCNAQAQSIKAGQKAAKSMQADRAELLEVVETAGDEWEAAEASRLFSDSEAAKADIAKQEYEALKAELTELETDLQSRVASLNSAVAAYNSNCVTKKS